MFKHGPPKDLFPYIIKFSQCIVPNGKPFFIQVTPSSGSVVRECTYNVENQIKKHGGEALLGWKIWEIYGLMTEAEFHTIWRSPNRALHDLTPNDELFSQVLFLPDPSLKYEGKQINNIRKPLNDDPNVRRFIEAHDALFEITNRGERAFEHGMIVFSDSEADELNKLRIHIAQLGQQITNSIPKRNDICRCGSGKKVKKCCFK